MAMWSFGDNVGVYRVTRTRSLAPDRVAKPQGDGANDQT